MSLSASMSDRGGHALLKARLWILTCLALTCVASLANAGITAYTEPGQTDFDTALQTINAYGTWSKINGKWGYTPFDHEAPYTNGRWLYTEYGWYWKGNRPHSWVTEHYGYWKRGNDDRVWSWYPGLNWVSEAVEIRETSTHIGWRSAEVDDEGNFVERPEDRWAKTDEWTFVTREQFANPITPKIVATPDEAASLLEDSTESAHTYVTYRAIDRPGPHPADFVTLCKDGGMFAPLTLQDRLAMQKAPPPIVIPGVTPGTTLTETNIDVNPPVPSAPSPSPATNTAPAPSGLAQAGSAPTGAAPNGLASNSAGAGQNTAAVPQAPAPVRKVRYWITRCLPTYWTPVPPDARPGDLYIYRPAFYQDDDGIARRIALWLDPQLLVRTKQGLASLLGGGASPAAEAKPAAGPATPAVPVGSDRPVAQDPFRSGLNPTYHGTNAAAPATSTKNPAPAGTNLAPNPTGP